MSVTEFARRIGISRKCASDHVNKHAGSSVEMAHLLADTWAGLIGRGPGWQSRAMEGLTALKEQYPDVDTSALVV